MSLKDILDEYKDQTRQLSNIARQLAFAAGAILWLFRGKESLNLPCVLLWCLVFLILYFASDLFQSIVAVWKLNGTISNCRAVSKHPEGTKLEDIPCEKDEKDLVWTESAFKIKIIFLVISYLFLIYYYFSLLFE